MSLVERFILIGYWPTSQRTVLWALVLVPIHLVVWLGVRVAAAGGDEPVVLADRVIGVWMAGLAISIALALRPALRGEDARWTAWLFVLLYTLPVVPVTSAVPDPIVFIYVPVIALFATVSFDERLGAVAPVYMVVAIPATIVAETHGITLFGEYPEAGVGLAARAINMLAVGNFVLVVLLCVLMVSARRIQDQRLAEARDAIRRYVPAQIADAILSGKHEPISRHERRKLTVFFSDIVGFTDISEELEPEDLSRVLNEYFAEMMKIAHKYGGTVDELSGDAILVFFGAPQATDDRDHALRAVRMALEMQAAMPVLNAGWRAAGITETLRVRMGLNTGVVTIGNFGSPDRMKYAALGKHVNLAARLQGHCEPGQVLLSEATMLLVQDRIRCTPVGELQMKGIQRPVRGYVAEAG